MELQQIDGVNLELAANQICIAKDMLCRKHFRVVVLVRRRPHAIERRDLRSRIEPLVWIATQCLAQKAITLAFSISPRRVEKVTSQIDRQLQGLLRLLIIGVSPASHPPESMGDLADFHASMSKLPESH